MYTGVGQGTGLSITGGGALVAGAWYHLAVVFNGTTATLYVNGVASAAGNPTVCVPGSAGPLAIAARADVAFQWSGSADEVAFFTSVLSASVIQSRYEAATTNAAGYATQILASTPAGDWRLDEPAYAVPDPSTPPVAANSGTAGATANGKYSVYSQPGSASAPDAGFGAGNYACGLNANGLPTSIGLGNPAELNFTGPITLMAWSKPTATDGLRNIISHGFRESPSHELQMRISGGAYDVGSWEPGEGVPSPAGMATADIGTWTFLVGTCDGTQRSLYRNGALVATNAGPRGAVLVDADWAIGSRGTGTERYFQGTLDGLGGPGKWL